MTKRRLIYHRDVRVSPPTVSYVIFGHLGLACYKTHFALLSVSYSEIVIAAHESLHEEINDIKVFTRAL
jgi:hypothetical protein